MIQADAFIHGNVYLGFAVEMDLRQLVIAEDIKPKPYNTYMNILHKYTTQYNF